MFPLDGIGTWNPVLLALAATVGTYLLTAIGTLPVLFFRSAPRRLMDGLMGFAGGVMVAASCWSLLVPAIASGGVAAAAIGLLAGGAFFYVADQMLPHPSRRVSRRGDVGRPGRRHARLHWRLRADDDA